MNGDNSDKKSGAKDNNQLSLSDNMFYEIEYDSSPMKGVGKFVLKSQPIEPPEKDEIRELFHRMRDIARQFHPPITNFSRFFDRRVQQDNSNVFYKQAMFMKDFEDDYPEFAPFSAYFPYYQMLGYEQLRTYFTWRSQVRKGVIQSTSTSYVFLYLYELLSNVGIDSPQEGLEQLLAFWNSYRDYDAVIDKYMIRWLKDYHIYYDLPHTFRDFALEQNLTKHYSKISDPMDNFEFFCEISKYDLRKSTFYAEDRCQMISDCFNFVIKRIRQDFDTAGVPLDQIVFSPTNKCSPWKPFKEALFYQWLKQPDRCVIISENEIYICRSNEWTFSTKISNEKGRQFVGYVMKKMESVLRKVTNYKMKITANLEAINQETLNKLNESGIFIEKMVETAVMEYYRDATKTIVTVDTTELARIRQEALSTQEALMVEEQNETTDALPVSIITEHSDTEPTSVGNVWMSLRDTLSEIEIQALSVILQGDSIKKFAMKHNLMLEVLADGINGKAMDMLGDNILDDEWMLYEDYEEQVKGMVQT